MFRKQRALFAPVSTRCRTLPEQPCELPCMDRHMFVQMYILDSSSAPCVSPGVLPWHWRHVVEDVEF